MSSSLKSAAIALGALLLAGRGSASPALHTTFEKYTLPNGLTVILHEDHHSPTVVVDSWVHVGSKEEAAGKSGFAHLFEHLMFMGTDGIPNGQLDKIMEAAGGQNNASTSADRTNYYETGPANLLPTFLWLEADRLATLGDGMTKAKVDLQRDVVKNERRQSFENRPYGKSDLLLSEHMYPAGHPYHHSVIGSHEDLTAATVDDVKQFFATYYVASNISVVVAGDFQPATAKKLIAKYLGQLPAKPVPQHQDLAPIPALSKSDALTVTDHVQLERVTLAWHSPANLTAGDAECDLLSLVLGGGKSSRLYRALVQTKLASSVNAGQRSQKEGSLFIITATAQPGHHAAELEKVIDAQLVELDAHPPTQAELDRARNLEETNILRSLEQPLGVAELLNEYQFNFEDPAKIDALALARYDAVTVDELTARAQLLHAPRFALVVVPETKPAAAKPAAAKSPAPERGL